MHPVLRVEHPCPEVAERSPPPHHHHHPRLIGSAHEFCTSADSSPTESPAMSEAIAKEIIIILKNHKEDQTHMDDINQEVEGIQKLQRARETSLEANITALSQTVEEEKKFLPLCDEGSFTPKEENVEMEISKVKKHREVVVRDLEKNMAKLEICKKVEENLIEERENVSDETAVKLPKMRYDVELYTNITGIRWHYDGEPDEIKGYISKGKNVKSFSLNTKKHSHFFITNYLWDLMEEEW